MYKCSPESIWIYPNIRFPHSPNFTPREGVRVFLSPTQSGIIIHYQSKKEKKRNYYPLPIQKGKKRNYYPLPIQTKECLEAEPQKVSAALLLFFHIDLSKLSSGFYDHSIHMANIAMFSTLIIVNIINIVNIVNIIQVTVTQPQRLSGVVSSPCSTPPSESPSALSCSTQLVKDIVCNHHPHHSLKVSA